MSFSDALLSTIRPADLRGYLRCRGWSRITDGIPDSIAVFRRPENENLNLEILIPQNSMVADFSKRILEALHIIAKFEGRNLTEVLNDLLAPAADIIRFRVMGAETSNGTISFNGGIDLFKSARKALLASSLDVLNPQKVHPRMSRRESDDFLSSCRLGQTERGSFIASVICPLDSGVDVPQQPLIPDVFEAPFSRKVTTNFIDSAARIVALIDADTPDSIVNPGEGQSQISANYLDALVELHASSDDGALHVGSTWSLAYPIPTTVPNGVQIPREYFSIIETCAKRLREEMAPTTMRVIGRVDELYGILGDDGHRSGEVLVSFQDDTEVIKATLTLNADAYSIAIGAHETGKFVSLNGTLVRARRKNKILDHSDFKVLE